MFGWPSLEKVMTEYGIFSHLCKDDEVKEKREKGKGKERERERER
jgi:hypothetical protein